MSRVPLDATLHIAAVLEGVWRIARCPGSPALTVEGVVLLGPLPIRDDKARRDLGYRATTSREAGFAALVALHA